MTQPGQDPQYEVSRKGNPVGIHPLGALSGLLASGQLQWTDDCWTEGMESWVKLSDIKQQIEAAAPAIPAHASSSNAPLFIGIGVSVLIVAGAAAYFLLTDEGESGAENTGQTTTSARPSSRNTARTAAMRKELSEIQLQISELVASSFVEKRFDGPVTLAYSHRYYDNIGNRIPLRVFVDATGKSHLLTFYSGKTWIFHDQLRFEFNKQSLQSSPIPSYKAYREVDESNFVTEICHFLADEDRLLVGKLAQAGTAPIKMKMLGRRPTEITLSYETKEAIRESHLLADLLAKRSKLMSELIATP